MGLKLDENYNGSTLLSEWWGKVKSNFAAVKAAFEQEITDRNAAISEAAAEEVTARNAAIDKAIAAEVTNRDTAINEAVADEATNRDSAIDEAIAAEVTARNAEISKSVAAETQARKLEDELLRSLIKSAGVLNVMSDYSLNYYSDNGGSAYAKGKPDDMPLGMYLFSPEQDVENIFLVSAEGENELASYSGTLKAGKLYIIRFESEGSELIAAFEGEGAYDSFFDSEDYTSISQIGEEIEALYDETGQLNNIKADKTLYANTEQYGLVKLNPSGGLILDGEGLLKTFVSANYGLRLMTNGTIVTSAATESDIDTGTNNYKVITPANVNYAARAAVGKYSDTPVQVGTWTDGNPVWRVTFPYTKMTESNMCSHNADSHNVSVSIMDLIGKFVKNTDLAYLINERISAYSECPLWLVTPDKTDGYSIYFASGNESRYADFIDDGNGYWGGYIEFSTPADNLA